MKDAKQQFATRLKKAMEARGFEARAAVLEREFGQRYQGDPVGLHGVRKWLIGGSIPTRDKLQVLESWLKADFLSFRPVKPQQVSANQVRQPMKEWRAELPIVERETVDAYLALPMQQRKIVREVILAFARK